jgi:hypothetical protein
MRTLLSLMLGLALVGCGPTPIKLANSPLTPAASGQITTEESGNGNLRLKIEVKHLAPPEKVDPGARIYVVWVEKAGAPPQNVGALEVDADLTGRLDTVTPFHHFNLMITAEEGPATMSPGGPRVLAASVER